MLQKKFYDVQIARLEKQIELCENELKDNDFDYLIDQHQHISEILFKKDFVAPPQSSTAITIN